MDEYKNLVNQKTSALSSLGNANRQALKYADTTALAQGYATQGARLQNVANMQNAYLNQVGGVNQQFQQQLGNLENTASTNALTQYTNRLANLVENTTLTDEQRQAQLNSLQNAYYGQMSANDIKEAQLSTQDVINSLGENQGINKEVDNQYKGLVSDNNNIPYETLFSNGTSINKNFTVTVDGNTYEVELGNQVDAYLTNSTKQKVYADSLDRQVGEIWEYSNGNKTVLLVKTGDSKNDIRVIEKAGVSAKDYEKLAKALGYERTKNFEKVK